MLPAETDNFELPSPPAALARVIEASSGEGVNPRELGRLVGTDPSLAAQILKLVNSSLYSRGAHITSIERAVSVLGSRALRNLALCVAVRSCVNRRELGEFDLTQFWQESLARAVAGRMLAERVESESVDPMEAFTCGLLQDLGVLALVRRHPEQSAAWMAIADHLPERRRTAERELFGKTHDELSPGLVAAWNLPPELAAPMCHHHAPAEAAPEHRQRARIAGQAEALAAVLSAADKREALEDAKALLNTEASMTGREVTAFLEELTRRVTDVADELGFKIRTPPSMEEILAAANTSLVEMNLSYEDLVQRLERTLEEKQALADELARRAKELEQLSLTDTLTSLPNRRALSGRMNYEVKRAARGSHLAFVVGDLDKFKLVNDTWGHEFGDVVLKMVADALTGAVRDVDMVSRMGGEEFGILLVGSDAAGVQIACERILQAVRTATLETPDGSLRSFTISLGASMVIGPFTGRVNAETIAKRMYKAADAALYRAKEGGRNRLEFHTAPLHWEPGLSAAA